MMKPRHFKVLKVLFDRYRYSSDFTKGIACTTVLSQTCGIGEKALSAATNDLKSKGLIVWKRANSTDWIPSGWKLTTSGMVFAALLFGEK